MKTRYDPIQYQQAELKFDKCLKAKGITNIALVWHSDASCSAGSNPIDAWYPGDGSVERVGLSFFAQADYKLKPIEAVLNFARDHHRLVMIIETAPQHYSASELSYSPDGAKFTHMTLTTLRKDWYVPFFDYIRNNTDVIKSVAYSNTFWDSKKMWGRPSPMAFWGSS